jgi:Transposase DDE domain group 1
VSKPNRACNPGPSPIMTDATPFLPGLSPLAGKPLAGKPLTAAMDAGNLSANGGLVALREVADRLGLARVIAGAIPDARNPVFVRHSYTDMITARMMMTAAGHEDCDDIDALKADPALKIACGRAPESGADLMSQPTLSRLEIAPGAATLFWIGRPRAWRPATLFNTHAGGHCFQPIHIFEGDSGKPILSLLRPGKRPSVAEGARVLLHVVRRIRRNWPKVRILVRADGTTAAPRCSQYCAISPAITSSASRSTPRSTRWPSPGASSARPASGRHGQWCAASTCSNTARVRGVARRK